MHITSLGLPKKGTRRLSISEHIHSINSNGNVYYFKEFSASYIHCTLLYRLPQSYLLWCSCTEEDLLGLEQRIMYHDKIVLFFGQGYSGGLLYDGQNMVNQTNIVLVTINYRLGALGFLVYGDKQEIGGNYGLKVG